ncbi:zinc-binding dehydrogenase [Jejubacter calystegiae]|uniref:Zinc-binding dehydrogenase n=1 Tax=Jejubacter calystegiae TaxID=2579935 RepID=A0A4P8YPC3_9ENTR|nr:alcohol dehydrogenase catalytic domain-containing protein [Jejubacter calystegiae]QCT20482.1 zinc-binding dehydrogenase [Jejubacter calystegiae]
MHSVTRVFLPDVNRVMTEEKEQPDEPLQPDEVRIVTRFLGICGSDLHVLKGHHPVGKPPIVPGHEIAAVVSETGADVTHLRPGDNVVVDPIMPCLDCPACRSGRFNLCFPPRVAGFRIPGFARSSMVVPARNLHKAPPELPMKVLAFAEPVACAHHCVTRLPESQRDRVLVIGAGTIGLSIIQALRIVGAREIAVVEPDERKRALALKLGAQRVVAPGKLAEDESFSGVIDVVAAPATIMEACLKVEPGGTVVCMGVPRGNCEIPLAHMQRFERSLVSSGMYVPEDFEAAISWLSQGLFDTRDLITDIFPVSQAPQAFERAQTPTSIKVLIEFGR